MKSVVLVFPILVTVAVASFWRHEKLAGQAAITPPQSFSCQSLKTASQTLNDKFVVSPQVVHVCPTLEGGICYVSSLSKCCSKPQFVKPLGAQQLFLETTPVDAQIIYVNRFSSCVHFGSQHSVVNVCDNGGTCFLPGCESPPEICTNNSLSGCDPSGCAQCKPGYKPLRCCECEDQYQKAEDGTCKFVCQTNCQGLGGQCTSCAHPYTGAPFCCDCAPPFVKGEDGVCRCPSGYHKIDGTCKRICTGNTIPCDNPPCCKTGFQAPLCCDCIYDDIGSGDSFFRFNGQCKKICKENAQQQHCNAASGCSRCEDSFVPPDCCECRAPLKLVEGVCRNCRLDEAVVGGRCREVCRDHIIQGTCDGTKCQCQEGYIGNDCCQCAADYVTQEGSCKKCPPGTVPDANQQRCICDQSDGKKKILVNGKCTAVCSNTLECSESSCKCKVGFASPDCCRCASGDLPSASGECPVPCIDNQNVVIVMDRSQGLGNTELYDEMLMIEILTGALLRETKNLTVSVVSYATNLHQNTPLMNMAPTTATSGKVTESQCNSILSKYEKNIVGTFSNKPPDTVSGRTMELLESYIKRGMKNTIITFPGTLSNNNPIDRINRGIQTMKTKAGVGNANFFAAGFNAENDEQDKGRRNQYRNEVIALADGSPDRMLITTDRFEMLKNLSNILYQNGVLCGAQKKAIQDTADSSKKLFSDYQYCIHVEPKPCISQSKFNGGCKRSSVEAEQNHSLVSAMRELLREFIN